MNDTDLRTITWLDSNAVDGWHDPAISKYGPLEVTTVGFLVREDDQSISIAGSAVFGKDHQTCSVMTIPKACIVTSERLVKL